MRKPIIHATPSPWGEASEAKIKEIDQGLTYVEGYSDKRKAFDEAVARGERPSSLPFRLHWVRDQSTSGSGVASRVREFRNKGYYKVKADDAKGLGIDIEDFSVSPDGYVVANDCVLMVADAADAAAAAANQQRLNEEFKTDAMLASEAASEEIEEILDLPTKKKK